MIHPCQSLHPSALFLSDFNTKFLYEFPISNMNIIRYSYVLCLNLIILTSSKEYIQNSFRQQMHPLLNI